ncbi:MULTISPECIES: methyltransferase [Burkholderia]|uniref:methyltransferase n=1 Tax=Burkholderia TaxID=32008 RepID=UPI000B7AAC39|nr:MULTISPECIES: methyltransferase [Burkholderia]MBY4722228.1 tRNA (adenine(22)-N(1))-methyltransferase TrmK [Burkholderia contaminans]MCI3968111.1 tRNA (adenine(22)-N(1))-methyltransferase TrmK [Burkholderia sp. HI4860]MDN7788386.1 tRNA (adenine(22)-N(1))-methyltransferase TrmK [Burkholderia contaminans]OXI95020.1 SAM-dependent methyltransferase [Burkholderia sp. AU33803]OXI97476.1 SAM-dependent methyltransferase [Burkholderia sp. AU33647]
MNPQDYESDAFASVRRRLAAAEADGVVQYVCEGRNFAVHAGVFPPTHFQSTGIFTRHLPYRRGGSFLEIGCGAGVTSVVAALSGCARVVAADISEAAVRNTQENVRSHGVADRVSARHGDLFDVLEPGERFDQIYWNSNFVFVPEDYVFEQPIMQAFCDAGYLAHRRFLREASRHLTPDGELLIGFSSLGDERALAEMLAEHNYSSTIVASAYGEGAGAHRYDILRLWPGRQVPAADAA